MLHSICDPAGGARALNWAPARRVFFAGRVRRRCRTSSSGSCMYPVLVYTRDGNSTRISLRLHRSSELVSGRSCCRLTSSSGFKFVLTTQFPYVMYVQNYTQSGAEKKRLVYDRSLLSAGNDARARVSVFRRYRNGLWHAQIHGRTIARSCQKWGHA